MNLFLQLTARKRYSSNHARLPQLSPSYKLDLVTRITPGQRRHLYTHNCCAVALPHSPQALPTSQMTRAEILYYQGDFWNVLRLAVESTSVIAQDLPLSV